MEKELPELYTIIVALIFLLLFITTVVATNSASPCRTTPMSERKETICKSRVVLFAWGDVTCAAYPDSHDCVLSTYRFQLQCLL